MLPFMVYQVYCLWPLVTFLSLYFSLSTSNLILLHSAGVLGFCLWTLDSFMLLYRGSIWSQLYTFILVDHAPLYLSLFHLLYSAKSLVIFLAFSLWQDCVSLCHLCLSTRAIIVLYFIFEKQIISFWFFGFSSV